MEELRQREANLTALQAIGPRKKIKLETADGQSGFVSIFDLYVFSTISLSLSPLLVNLTFSILFFYWWEVLLASSSCRSLNKSMRIF